MTETLGTGVLYLTADTTSLETGVERAKRAQEGLGKTTEQTSQTTERASKRQQEATRRAVETFGKSREEVLKWQVAQRFAGDEAVKLNAKIDAQAAKLNAGAAAFNKYGVSAKQQAAALRGVPAQVTDIFTSLASGQRPITVLLQQGGQLKDMFGGVVPAAKALGSAVLGLVNPFTVAAGAAAALFFAWKQGDDEAVGFRQSLALTGNAAGTTADEMQAMALAISQGVPTQHQAALALAEVARTGKFAGDQLKQVAEAALAMEKATGQAVSQTVAEFAKFRGDPVKALAELNDQYHFLTLEVFEQVKALQAQGREEEALSVAIKAASGALTDRANEVVQNASYMERAWKGLGAVVRQVWDDIRNAGRASTAMTDAQMKIASANSELNALSHRIKGFVENGGIYTPEREARDRREIERLKKVKQDAARVINDDPAAKAAREKAAQQRAQESAIALDQEASSFDTAVEKLTKRRTAALGRMNEAVKQAGDNTELVKSIQEDGKKIVDALDKQIADAQERQDKRAGGSPSPRGARAAATPSRRAIPDLDTSAAARELEALAAAEARATESFRDLEAQLQGPMAVAIRDHEKRVAELNALAAQSPEASAKLSAALEMEAERHRKVTEELKAQQEPWDQTLAAMRAQLELIGMGNTEQAVANDLMREGIDLSSQFAQAKLAEARAIDTTAVAQQKAIGLMDEFRGGAADALTDFVTGAKSAKEALTDFFDNLAETLTRMIAEQWIEKAFGAFGSNGSGTSGGQGLASLIGAFFGGGSSAASGDWFGFWKNGGAFANGAPVEYFARGDVFNQATAFNTGRGIGVMGEAGPEAIMPLARGPDGKLGVRADTQQQRPSSFALSQTFVVQGTPDRRTTEQMARAGGREARRGMARTGG